MQKKIPHWIHMVFLMATCLLFVPPALIARARYNKTTSPRVHIFPDMDNQKYYRKQAENVVFADGRSMRLPVEGTVAFGELRDNDHLFLGRDASGNFVSKFPPEIELNRALLDRGQGKFNIFCAPCHAEDGHGDGPVHRRASYVSQATWTAPTSLHAEGPDGPPKRSVGHLFNTITHGLRNMPPYAAQIPDAEDRWAIIAYVRALQLSQNAVKK